ncbi:MAG: metalloregulator ArsR/SmtB family transcription factor [Candidatus Woesearchaeota archaeon]
MQESKKKSTHATAHTCQYHLFFEKLGNELRLQILLLLYEHGPLPVTTIAKHLCQEQSKISHALAELSQCNLVFAEKKGRLHYYHVPKKTIAQVVTIATTHQQRWCRGCMKKKKGPKHHTREGKP